MFAVRPDATVPALQDIVEQKLGKFFLYIPPFDLAKCFADSKTNIPLIFILSTGSDPMSDIAKLAEGMGMLVSRVCSSDCPRAMPCLARCTRCPSAQFSHCVAPLLHLGRRVARLAQLEHRERARHRGAVCLSILQPGAST